MQDPTYTEGQRLQGSDGNVYVVQNGVPTLERASSAPLPLRIGTPDPSFPYEAQRARAQAGAASAQEPYAGPIAAAQAREAQLRVEKQEREAREWAATHHPDGSPKPSAAGNPEVTAATRTNAINAFTATRQLDQLIAEIEERFKAGPGSTKGVAGVQDWLPLPSNRRFDAAGNAVRGAAITALGFTSGQTNSPQEVAMNVGPYIPSAGDYDDVILDKIGRLKELRDRARVQSVTVLGGIPDASGRVIPVSELSQQDRDRLFPPGTMQPGVPGGGAGGGGGGGAPTDKFGTPYANVGGEQSLQFTGDAKEVTGYRLTPEQQAQIVRAQRNGDRGEALALMQRFSGYAPGPDTIKSIERNIEVLKRNPNAQIPFDYGSVDDAARQKAERERYGAYLPEAVQERQNGAAATARGVISGATLGIAPYAAAALQSGGGLWGDFNDRLQHARAIDEADYRNNPWPRGLGEVAGGVPTAIGFELGAARVGANIPGMAGRFVGSPRTADAVFGATTAATQSGGDPFSSGAGAAVAAGGGMMGRQAARSFGTPLADRIAAARGVAFPSKPSAADSMLYDATQKAGPGNIVQQLDEARALGVPMSLADTSKELGSLAGASVRRSPTAAQFAEGQFLPRSRGQIDRFGQAVERDLGPVENIPQLSADLMKAAKAKAGPLYDTAYAQPGAGAIYPQIEPFLARPSMREALGNATTLAREEGRDPTALGFTFNEAGEPALTRVPSWQTLDYVKRGLDDVVEGYRDTTTGKLNLDTRGQATNSTLRDFLKVVDDGNPDYAAARAAYAGPAQEASYLRRGQAALTQNPGQLGVNIGDLTPERMAQMRLGYQSSLMDAGNRVRYSTNPFDATLGTPAAEQRLATMYQGNPGVSRLLRQRDLEAQMARSSNDILGNSKTAERGIADESFMSNPIAQGAADFATNTMTGGVPVATMMKLAAGRGLRDAWKLGLGKRAVQKADDLAPRLFNTDPNASVSELARVLASVEGYRGARNSIGRRGGVFGAPLLLPLLPSEQ